MDEKKKEHIARLNNKYLGFQASRLYTGLETCAQVSNGCSTQKGVIEICPLRSGGRV